MLETETGNEKRPYKFIEIPLNKFRDEVIPHHQSQFDTHKTTLLKNVTISNHDELQKDLKQNYAMVRQLKNVIYELDALRTQVESNDLSRFNVQATPLKREISALIQKYIDLEAYATSFLKSYPEDNLDDLSERITQQNCQLSLEGDFHDLQLYDKERQLQRLEALNRDIEDVHEIFGNLQGMVEQQKESVDLVEDNVEIASSNTRMGLKHLIQATRLKAASFPVAGACIGTMIGGPIGSVAGLKIGAVAAIGFGVVGYIGGKFVKKKKIESVGSKEIEMVNQVAETNEDKKTK